MRRAKAEKQLCSIRLHGELHIPAHICIAKKTIKSILINQLLLKLTLNFNCKIWIIDRENQTFTNPKLIVFR